MGIATIEIGGDVGRQIDRMLGRLPKLDAALKERLPGVARDIGEKVVSKARGWAPVASGNLVSKINHQVREGATAVIGLWGIPYAYMIDFGINSRMLVPKHTRRQTQVFGESMTPKEVEVKTFVRHVKFKGRDFMHRAYYASFPAMFGILNKAMEEAKEEADLGD